MANAAGNKHGVLGRGGFVGANAEANPNELDNLFKSIDFEIDFDTSDFDFLSDEQADRFADIEAQEHVRILKPKADGTSLEHHVMFENAEEFARQLSLVPGERTFAWLSGNFIFGDMVEALITARNVTVKKLYVTSLSFSRDNIDSLKNVLTLMGERLENMVLIFSGYQYSHEKYNLVPYMYRELDNPLNNVQIAFGGWHTKIITLETCMGNYITMHGSCNLRSSNSIEQIMIEINNKELHDFNAGIMQNIADKFGTINHGAPYQRLNRLENKQAWEISKLMLEEKGSGK